MKRFSDDKCPSLPSLAEVLGTIDEAVPSEDIGAREWSMEIKGRLAGLGRKLGWEVRHYDRGTPYTTSWLLDHTWTFSTQGHLRKLALVMTIEPCFGDSYWNVIDGFEKLLAVRAPIKVMAFAVYLPESENYFARLGDGINAYCLQDSTEQYIIACWNGRTRLYDIRIWNDGRYATGPVG